MSDEVTLARLVAQVGLNFTIKEESFPGATAAFIKASQILNRNPTHSLAIDAAEAATHSAVSSQRKREAVQNLIAITDAIAAGGGLARLQSASDVLYGLVHAAYDLSRRAQSSKVIVAAFERYFDFFAQKNADTAYALAENLLGEAHNDSHVLYAVIERKMAAMEQQDSDIRQRMLIRRAEADGAVHVLKPA